MTKQILRGPSGIKLELDATEIFPDDPGMGTPALVVMPNGDTGSFSCVSSEGETVDGTRLTKAQMNWLQQQSDRVDQFLTEHAR